MDPSTNEDCVICLGKMVNSFTLPCDHTFCYMCLKRVAEDRKPCPLCNALIPNFVLEKVKVSEESINLKDVVGKWMYSGRNNGWWYYSPEHDEIIEEVWNMAKKYRPDSLGSISLNINILGRLYLIDFDKMTQSADSGVIRNIKRVEKFDEGDDDVKGISGIQVVKNDSIPTMPDPVWPDPDQYVFNSGAWDEDENSDENSDEDDDDENSDEDDENENENSDEDEGSTISITPQLDHGISLPVAAWQQPDSTSPQLSTSPTNQETVEDSLDDMDLYNF